MEICGGLFIFFIFWLYFKFTKDPPTPVEKLLELQGEILLNSGHVTQAQRCPHCQAQNEDGSPVCFSCGKDFIQESPSESVTEPEKRQEQLTLKDWVVIVIFIVLILLVILNIN
ncbi:MAG: hypothetical protein KC415_05580 [Anaerolineales bacterium]|nr:hypothetical protein [Anaerolineales bacterium]